VQNGEPKSSQTTKETCVSVASDLSVVPEDPGITLDFMEHSDIVFRQGTGICHTLIAIGDKFRLQSFFCPHAPYESARDKAASMCRLLLQGETCARNKVVL